MLMVFCLIFRQINFRLSLFWHVFLSQRSQRGILKSFGLSENPNPKKLDDLTKTKIKGTMFS